MNHPLTLYWHDYETFGKNPRWARPSQFAGVRTDTDLNIIGEPRVIYCQPATDTLPDPDACLITGITPQRCLQKGLPEHEFAKKILAEFSVPHTCGVGYNSIRFDDEFTRHLLYRNFYDPYEREWKNGNSRWDILDVLRLMYALRPDGMAWPLSEAEADKGRPIFKLQALTQANQLQHDSAHDALSDVLATIALAKKMKQAQPKLFDYAFSLRDKKKVAEMLDLVQHKPVFHVSSRLQWQHGYAALMMPLCKHPTNSNGVICYDLSMDPAPLIALSSDDIAERVFVKKADLPEGVERIPLKTIHLNKSPMVASLSVLDEAAAQRLRIDRHLCETHWQQIMGNIDRVCGKAIDVMSRDSWQEIVAVPDPEFMLYQGFLSNRDRSLCDQIHRADAKTLSQQTFAFSDKRLAEMLFRYRARNFPDSLYEEERHQWEEFRFQRLNEKLCEDYYDLESYHARIAELASSPDLSDHDRQLLADLVQWADQVL
jgi:exodeoxyribonuclease-1